MMRMMRTIINDNNKNTNDIDNNGMDDEGDDDDDDDDDEDDDDNDGDDDHLMVILCIYNCVDDILINEYGVFHKVKFSNSSSKAIYIYIYYNSLCRLSKINYLCRCEVSNNIFFSLMHFLDKIRSMKP